MAGPDRGDPTRAELVESRADSHMIWFAPDYPAIAARIRAFLLTDHHTAGGT